MSLLCELTVWTRFYLFPFLLCSTAIYREFIVCGYTENHTHRGLLCILQFSLEHYNDVIMSVMASQISSLTIVYQTVYSRHSSKKTWKLRVTGLFVGDSPVTSEFPAQRASNAENVSIWWRHHEISPACNMATSLALRQLCNCLGVREVLLANILQLFFTDN